MASRSGGRNDRTSSRSNAGTSTSSGPARNATAGRTSGSSSGSGSGASAGGRTNTTGTNATRPNATTSSAASAPSIQSSPTGKSAPAGQGAATGQSGPTGQRSTSGQSSSSSGQSSGISGQSGSTGGSAGVNPSSMRADQERELHTSREEQGNMRPAASRQRGNIGQQGVEQWAPIFASGSPFAMMRRMMEDMDRLFSDFGFSHPGAFASSLLNPGTWGTGQAHNAIGGGSSGSHGVAPASSRQGVQRGGRPGLSQAALRSLWAPQVEIFERGTNLVIRADLPGLSREDVDVEIDEDALIIRGERHNDVDDEQEGYYRSERSYGSFYRAIPLPDNIDPSQCDASFRDGVLEVSIPKPRQQSRAQKVEVRG